MLKKAVVLPVLVLTALAALTCGGAAAPDKTAPAKPAAVTSAPAAATATPAAAAPAAAGTVTPMSAYDLGRLKGKVTFVELWGVWCGPCIMSMPHVQELYEKYQGNPSFNMMVVNTGWRSDNVERVKAWLGKNPKYTFPVYFDDRPQDKQFATQNQVNSIPRSIIMDKKGQVKYNGHPAKVPAGLLDKLLAE